MSYKSYKKYSILGDTGIANFDWDEYDSVDFRRRVHNKQWVEEYNAYSRTLPKDKKVILTKEDSAGTLQTIRYVHSRMVTDNSIVVSCQTTSGYSFPVDLRKDKFLVAYFFDRPWSMENALDFYNGCDNGYATAIADLHIPVYFNENNQPDIKAAFVIKVREEMENQIGLPTPEKTLYTSKIIDVNPGGFNVDIDGLICFLPLSQSGIIISGKDKKADITEVLSEYIGDFIDVVVSGIGQNDSIVVSNREYTNMCVKESQAKLQASDEVLYNGRITGVTYFGLFIECEATDIMLPSGQPLHFSGLLHTSVMSDKLYTELQNSNLFVGEPIQVYINSIVDEKKINLSDMPAEEAARMSVKRAEEKAKAKEAEEMAARARGEKADGDEK